MPPASKAKPMRLVLDTNVVVAGLLWNGPPRQLIEWAIADEVAELFSSPMLIDELTRTLGYAKFTARIESLGVRVPFLVNRYSALVSLVRPSTAPRVVFGDADDDQVIAAAVAAHAELIVTGDRKHLLPIGNHQGIEIVTARAAVDRFEARRTS